MLEESSLFKPEDVSTLPGKALFLYLCQAESSTCSLLHNVPSSVYKAAAVVWKLCIAELQGSGFRDTQLQPVLLWLSPHGWNKCAGEYLAEVWGISRILEQSREDARSELLPHFCSQLFLQSPAHVRFRRASSLWTCESVVLHTGLSLPCSSLSVALRAGRDRRLLPYPCGLILSTGALPALIVTFSWCRRCTRSCTVQVPSEQPCLLDWLAEFLDLLVRTLMSVLECGSKVSLISSGLINCSDSAVFSSDTLSRSRLNLLPSHMLSLFLNSGFTSSSTQCATVASRQQ